MNQRRFKRAEKRARQALAEAPGDTELLTLLAGICAQDGRTQEAEKCLVEAGQAEPHVPARWVNLAQLYAGQARFGEAEEVLAEAMRKLPDAGRLPLELGLLKQRAGRFEEACELLQQACELMPKASRPRLHLGMVLNRLDRLDEAANALRSAIELTPDLAAAHGNLGNVEQRRGNLEKAAAAYEKATELQPRDAQAHVSLGIVKLRQGDARSAADIFEHTLRTLGPERRAAAWLPIAQAMDYGEMPLGIRAELGRHISRHRLDENGDNLAKLNDTLVQFIKDHPSLTENNPGRATRDGSETALLQEQNKAPLSDFLVRLGPVIDRYFDNLSTEPKHPYRGQIPQRYQLDLWGAVLPAGGHQISHIQAGGWMSGVYFVSVPDSISENDGNHSGWVDFGHPPAEFELSFDPRPIPFAPKTGDALFFPSYAFRRVLNVPKGEALIMLCFNVRPVTWRQ